MPKTKIQYRCSDCGHTSAKWLGHCPACNEWHTFEEVEISGKKPEKHKVDISSSDEAPAPVRLSEIEYSESERITSGIGELDRVLGGGFVPASLILLGGDPGIGKSTLMLQIAKSRPELELLYVAGEESASQIRQRADRIGIRNSQMKVLSVTDLDRMVEAARKEKPDLLVVDSIQTVYRSQLASLPGSVQQIRECAAVLQQLSKREGVTTLMIGHVTKEGEIAGPRILEHMVDTVLHFEGEQDQFHRLLRGVKNRFGPAQEVGVFEMNDRGLKEVDNPSALFLSGLDQPVSGSAVTCVMEGSRPLLVEVQALVTPSSYATPQRTAGGFDHRRMSLLLAVLEKRAGIRFADQDVYLNVAGGLRVTDTAADLAVVCALASSFRNSPLPGNHLFIGEVGLGGELRMVPHLKMRMKEGAKLGFESCLAPKKFKSDNSSLDVNKAGYLHQALDMVLST